MNEATLETMTPAIVAAQAAQARLRLRIALAFATCILIWGSTWMVIRGQLGVVDPSWSVSYRFLIGGLVIFAYGAAIGAPLRLGRGDMLFAAGLGVLQCWLNFVLIYHSEAHITSGVVALVFSLQFIINTILGRIFLGTRPTSTFIIGAIISAVGMILLFWHQFISAVTGGEQVALGFLYCMFGLLSASSSNIMQASARGRRLPPLATLGWAMVFGAVLNGLFARVTIGPPSFDVSFSYVASLLYLALGSSLTFPLFHFLIRHIGPGRAAYTSVVVPILAMALSTLFEDYQWTLMAAGGAVLALAGLLVSLPRRV